MWHRSIRWNTGWGTSHGFVYELLAGVKVSSEDQPLMEVREHGMLQSDPCFLLQGLEGFCVVVLPEVFQAQSDGLLFTVLSGKTQITLAVTCHQSKFNIAWNCLCKWSVSVIKTRMFFLLEQLGTLKTVNGYDEQRQWRSLLKKITKKTGNIYYFNSLAAWLVWLYLSSGWLIMA